MRRLPTSPVSVGCGGRGATTTRHFLESPPWNTSVPSGASGGAVPTDQLSRQLTTKVSPVLSVMRLSAAIAPLAPSVIEAARAAAKNFLYMRKAFGTRGDR